MTSRLHLLPLIASICAISVGGRAHAQQYETAPVLEAKKILRPEILSGKSHQVAAAVESEGFLNRYELVSTLGNFTALGNEQLIERIKELEAIARLQEYKQSAEFAKTLEQTATGTVDQALNLVFKPGKSLAMIGNGVGKSFVRGREKLRRGLKKSGAEKEQASLLYGIDTAKRTLANQLDVDPYSTNALLQEELTRVATPVALANLSVTVGTFAIPGSTALTAYKGVKSTSDLSEKVKAMSPIDLRTMNREQLDSLGVDKKVARRFLDEAWLPPIDQAVLIKLISGFESAPAEGKRNFIARASDAANEADANFFARIFSLLALYEEREKTTFTQLSLLDGFPIGITDKNQWVIPLDIDLLAWTEPIATQVSQFKAPKGSIIYLSGRTTTLARSKLKAAGFVVKEDGMPGVFRDDWKP